MNDLIREIQEDIQREKWLTLWDRFGRTIITIAAVLIVLAAANAGWKVYRHSVAETDMSKILNAVRNPNADAFAKVAKQTSGVHSGIARLIQAQLLLASGKQSEAEGIMKALASNGKGLPAELARALTANAKSSDDTNSPFRATALERSGWAAIDAKEYDAATKAFKALELMEKAPESMKERARSALAFIQAESAQETPKAKE